MANFTVRIDESSYKMLRELAAHTGEPRQSVLAKALEQYRRQRFLEEANADYANLRKDSKAWKEVQAEWKLCDKALGDGLEGV